MVSQISTLEKLVYLNINGKFSIKIRKNIKAFAEKDSGPRRRRYNRKFLCQFLTLGRDKYNNQILPYVPGRVLEWLYFERRQPSLPTSSGPTR